MRQAGRDRLPERCALEENSMQRAGEFGRLHDDDGSPARAVVGDELGATCRAAKKWAR
jgi:hypothetical protein